MSQEVRQLEPNSLWQHFDALNAVPRPSKKEEKVKQFIKDFGQQLGLETLEDEVGNILIKKTATNGMEDRATVVLQSHLDMVHQKNNDTPFDFETQGIQMYVDGDWVKARGTTLGADNGIGVAAIMAVLSSSELKHPAIEALFTIDEETGMTGAMGLQGGWLTGDILLNLDTEEDDELDIGCAGGIDITASRQYKYELTPDNSKAYLIEVKGLCGGHSGMDIHKGLGNANKILTRLLFDGFENFGLQIASIDGGGLRNAIPRESNALIVIPEVFNEHFNFEISQMITEIQSDFEITELNLSIEITPTDCPPQIMDLGVQEGLIRALYAVHNGVYKMSASVEGLVETSNNLARVIVNDNTISVQYLTRSSSETSKFDLANSIRSAFELIGCEVEFSGDYPGWTPKPDAPIVKLMTKKYESLFNHEPRVVACHAGLECGILGSNYPEMQMISFGPNILGAHSPDERVSISSVKKFWHLLTEVLADIPIK